MNRYLPPLLAAFLLVSIASAQSIKGRVTDSESGRPLAGITVAVARTTLGTVTDASGQFELNGLTNGDYQLEISAVGYETLRPNVTVPAGNALTFMLKKAVILLNNEIIVTAQRFESQSFDAPQAVSVLSQNHIRQTAPRSTPELLMGTTGVFVQKTNHGGGSPIVRGLMGNQVLLMMDGIRLNNATYRYGPNQYLATVDPLLLERVEVTRGSGSVLYGSDALGGVVQLISKTPSLTPGPSPKERGGKSSLGGAFFGKWMSAGMERTGRGEVRASTQKVAFLGGFSAKNFGDLLAGGDLGFQSPSAYQERAGDAKILVKTSHRSLLTASYQHLYQYDVPVYYRVVQDNYLKYSFIPQARTLAYLRWEKYSDHKWLQSVRFTASLNRSVEGVVNQRNKATTINRQKDVVNTYGGIVEVHSQPTNYWNIHSGAEYYFDRVNSTASTLNLQTQAVTAKRGYFADGSTMGNASVFTSHTVDWRKFQFSGGLRFNAITLNVRDEAVGNPRISPSALVGHFATTYQLHPNHHLIAATNTGFRSPNLDDVSKLGNVEANVFEVPNANLSPEKTFTLEAGYKFRTNRLSGSLMAFRTNLTNQIVRVESSFQGETVYQNARVYTKTNAAESLLHGGEAEAEVKIMAALVAFGSLTYTYGQDLAKAEPMRRIPPLFGRLGLRSNHKGFSGRAEYIFAGKQDRLAGGDKSDIRISSRLDNGATPAWNVLNIYAGYSYRKYSLNTGVQNLLNQAYRMHGSGVDGVGRSLWIALTVGV